MVRCLHRYDDLFGDDGRGQVGDRDVQRERLCVVGLAGWDRFGLGFVDTVGDRLRHDVHDDRGSRRDPRVEGDSGCGFDVHGWSGACTGTKTCSVTMTAAKSVTATFTVNRYKLSVSRWDGFGLGVFDAVGDRLWQGMQRNARSRRNRRVEGDSGCGVDVHWLVRCLHRYDDVFGDDDRCEVGDLDVHASVDGLTNARAPKPLSPSRQQAYCERDGIGARRFTMRRFLVVAHQTLSSSELLDELTSRAETEESTFHLLVPSSWRAGVDVDGRPRP